MSINDNVSLAAGVAVQLTNANASSIRVQNPGNHTIKLQATVGAVEPTDWDGSLFLGGKETLAADLTIAQLWPGVSGANRVYAICDFNTFVSVSHADA